MKAIPYDATLSPIVVRDLRAQMRGTKSYWYIGGYLLLLGILVVIGYSQAVRPVSFQNGADAWSSRPVSIVDAQSRLQELYNFLFWTLAGLVTLIAPALTALSVVGERQRQSFDLLVTTPMSAAQMLWGKLVSSVAFLLLLLALSLPATALCVLLGGATIADVFRVYLLLLMDGLLLAGIGLYFSCAVRVPLLAVVWTYLSVAVFVYLTFLAMFASGNGNLGAMGNPTPLLAIAALSPFAAPMPPLQQSLALGPISIPIWIVAAGLTALGLRFLVTAAAYRLGHFGGSVAVSLRRQLLFLSGLLAALLTNSIGQVILRQQPTYTTSSRDFDSLIVMVLSGMAAFALPFLPGLFVPAASEDGPPGQVEENARPDDGAIYRFRRALRPEHAGALPYFHLWLGATLIGGLFGAVSVYRALPLTALPTLLAGVIWLSAVSFLFWTFARRAAFWVRDLSARRAVTFGLMIGALGLPLMLLALTSEPSLPWDKNPLALLWPLYPFLKNNPPSESAIRFTGALLLTAALTSVTGALLLAWERRRG